MITRTREQTTSLLGVPIDSLESDALVTELVSRSERRSDRGGFVATVNLDGLRLASRSPMFRERLLEAEFRVADGAPLLWASRLQGTPLPSRVAGSDLIFALSEALAATDRTIFLLGGNAGAADAAASELMASFPELTVSGTYCPPIGFTDDPAERARLRKAVVAAQPDFVYVGLPFQLAAEVARDLHRVLPSAWFLGLGVSFSFVSGEIPRAPRWMQRAGLEWLHRLAQEHRRLFARYVVHGLPFAAYLFAAALLVRLGSRVGRYRRGS